MAVGGGGRGRLSARPGGGGRGRTGARSPTVQIRQSTNSPTHPTVRITYFMTFFFVTVSYLRVLTILILIYIEHL